MLKCNLRNFVHFVFLVCVLLTHQEVLSLWSRPMITRQSGFLLRDIVAPTSTSTDSPSAEVTDITRDKDEHYMRLALRHAQHAFREKEVPIGAVIVDADGVILATSRNQVEATHDVTAHAEISCIRKAAKMKKNWRLSECTLYSTLEPCPMCMGAIQASRITKVVFGAPDIRMGACGSWVNLVDSKHPFHSVEVVGGLLSDESSTLLKRFFQMRRREASEKALGDSDSDNIDAVDSGVPSDNTVDAAVNNSSKNSITSDAGGDDSDVDGDSCDSASSSHSDRGFHFNQLLDLDVI